MKKNYYKEMFIPLYNKIYKDIFNPDMRLGFTMENNDKIPELSQGEFEAHIKKDLNVVQFFAEWCMPCTMMLPIMEDLSEKFKGKIKFSKVNIEENHELAQKFNVKTIPHFVLFKDGEQIEQQIGSISSEDFENKLNEFV